MRCNSCLKKLNSIMKDVHTCKCKQIYCGKHMFSHNCNYNFMKEHQIKLRKNLPIIIKNKNLQKI